MSPIPTVEEVDHIAGLPDPVLRNLQITFCYHELSVAMQTRTGPCANWCTFATWASKQAGQTIRREDLARALKRLLTPRTDRGLDDDPQQKNLRQCLWEVLNPARILARSSDAVARGNRKVFAEIGREFARFLAILGSDAVYDQEKLDQFIISLKDGDPPDGQRYLRRAFARYYQAFFETDAKRRAELMLCANIEIGLHEQTRLQPEIAEALDASVGDPEQFTREMLGALFPYRTWPAYALLLFMRLLGRPLHLDLTINKLFTALRRRLRLLLTEHLMVLCIPEGKYLQLGTDLRASFPELLRQLDDADLQLLLAGIDPTPDSLQDTGALDWADLSDRLHYIADLFRCHQETADLWAAPFTEEQILAINAERIPEGEL